MDNTSGELPELDVNLSDGEQNNTVDAATPAVVESTPSTGSDEDAVKDTDTTAQSEEQEPSLLIEPRPELNNAEQDHQIFIPIDSWDDNAITLPLAPETTERVTDYTRKLPNENIGATEQGREWADALQQGMRSGVYRDYAGSSAQRAEAQWRQQVKAEAKILIAGRPKIGDDSPMLTGARGVMQVNAMLGRGSVVQIPLWHSGFWITIKAPKEGRLLEMWQRMAEEKIMLGRVTHGLAFANHAVFTAANLIDLVAEHIYEHTVKDVSITELRDMISTLDVNTLAWGMACAIWPRGFQYTRSILDPQGQVLQVIKEKLNVAYLHFVDTASIDDYQRNHMAMRGVHSMSKVAIDTYRERFTRGKPRTYELSPDVHVTLAVPNVNDYLTAGQAWVNETVATISSVFTDEEDPDARNEKILDQARATSMRQYRHWVKSFEFPTLGKTMEDPETITMECDSLSGDDALRKRFFEVVRDYIADSTIAIIATPLANNLEKERTSSRFPWLLQMDPISTFFILLDQKVYQIKQRL